MTHLIERGYGIIKKIGIQSLFILFHLVQHQIVYTEMNTAITYSTLIKKCTSKSSIYTITFEIPFTTVSIRRWKLAGQPSRPIGLVTHWNWPMPGTVKAV